MIDYFYHVYLHNDPSLVCMNIESFFVILQTI